MRSEGRGRQGTERWKEAGRGRGRGEAVGEKGGGVWGLGGRERKKRKTGTDEGGRGHGWRRA